MSTSSLDRFLYWIMFNLGTIRSADVPKPHPGPHRLTASHNKPSKKVRLGYPVPANFSRPRRHIGIPSVPRFSLTGPNKSPILPKNTDFHTQNHRFYRKTQGISPAHEGISPTPLFFDHVIHGRRHLGSRDPLSTNQSAGLDPREVTAGHLEG
ncbi:hypothetical protein J6590_074707 [Homalodisca vitripennis]|nr:hypothetical protein J6590_074707 [Homalodisca vitripennis]